MDDVREGVLVDNVEGENPRNSIWDYVWKALGAIVNEVGNVA